MARITGIGGIFFRSADPEKSRLWYEKHLGVSCEENVGVFRWREDKNAEKKAMTVWSPFSRDSKYWDLPQQTMINYRVKNLDKVLKELEAEGVWIDEKREESEYGKFAWIKDLDGNRVELWEPPKDNPKCY